MNSTAQDEITGYVEGVRAALAGLPPATIDELLEDLPEHLAEVQAEAAGTLVERLGTPEAYAAELRATAGFVSGLPDPPVRRLPFVEVRDKALRLLGRADVKIGPALGYERASQFLVLLRPAWWLLRGYLVAMVLGYLLDGGDQPAGLLPRVGGNELAGLVLLVGCVLASIWLGRRQLGPWPRYALLSGTVVLVLIALGGFFSADNAARNRPYQDVGNYYSSNPYSQVEDLFVYDSTGKLVENARLFDQNGQPIMVGSGYCTDPVTGEQMRSRAMGYPHCPQNAPYGPQPPSLEPTAGPSVSPPPQNPASPSASASPSVSANPSGSASPGAAAGQSGSASAAPPTAVPTPSR